MRRLLTIAAATALATAAQGAAASEHDSPAVRGSVQVTADVAPTRAHSAPQLAHNPTNGELVVGEVDVRGDRRCAVHISADGGRSWVPGGDPTMPPFTDCSIGAEWGTYLTVFFDEEGTLYVPFAANDPAVFASSEARDGGPRSFVPRHIFLARSQDGGRTFETTMLYEAPRGDPARGYAYAVTGAIDPSDRNRIYVTWAQGDFLSLDHKTHAAVAASDDGGRTFAAPADITDEQGSEGAWLAVGRDGTVHAAYYSLGWNGERTLFEMEPDEAPLPLIHARSSDGGKTWARQEIDPGYQQYERPPQIVADPGSDTLYVVWFGDEHADNLVDHFDDAARADVWLRASHDGGATWGERVRVNDADQPDTNQVHPGAAVAPDGRLDVAWYDYRHSPVAPANPLDDPGTTYVFLSSSFDQGRSFGPDVRVSDRGADRSVGVLSNRVNSAGPVGIASTKSEAFLAWQDTRAATGAGQAEDVYAASVVWGVSEADDGPSPLQAGVIGAGLALAAGGILLVLTLGARRQR